MDGPPRLSVNQIGEFVQRESCLRRFKLGLNDMELAKRLPYFATLRSSLDPVLQWTGREKEDRWAEELRRNGLVDLGPIESNGAHVDIIELFDHLQTLIEPGKDCFVREVSVAGQIGSFHLDGRMDFVILHWRSGRPVLRLVECKASRKDRTYHRIQLATYRILVEQLLEKRPMHLDGHDIGQDALECVVARLDEDTGQGQEVMGLTPLDLQTEMDDVRHLLDVTGPLAGAYRLERLDLLPYRLSSKCDTCLFCPDCLPESARTRRLELMGTDPTIVGMLHKAGIESIDDLADLELYSEKAEEVRKVPGFSANLEMLISQARARRSTLPGSGPDQYQVVPYVHSGKGQLPPHVSEGVRLVRVYLTVEREYIEDRVVALAAHVTDSDGTFRTQFRKGEEGKWRPDPNVGEEHENVTRPIRGRDVVRFRKEDWSREMLKDDAAERDLLQGFFNDLVEAIADIAGRDSAPVHFYVWSGQEMSDLIDACERVQGGTLHHLTELLGCRQPTEQLIYSSLQDEISSRFALGWTSRSLVAACSLKWFGRSFHWVRELEGKEVRLDRIFEQDIFNFKTGLTVRRDGNWGRKNETDAVRHTFEIRTKHRDEVRTPYWYALWGVLPEPPSGQMESNVREAVRRYREAGHPEFFELFLRSRGQALRWVEERVQFKNPQISKPGLDLNEMRRFSLPADGVRQASIDFLRLDHHVKQNEWLAYATQPPINRIIAGTCVPVRDLEHMGNGLLNGRLDLERLGMDRRLFEGMCNLGEGSFVRVSPCSADPDDGQSMDQLLRQGVTANVLRLDYVRGIVELSIVPARQADRYRLISLTPNDDGPYLNFATLDESPSDYVASNVESRLIDHDAGPAYRWFDPSGPSLEAKGPIEEERLATYRRILDDVRIDGFELNQEQIDACLDGLQTRVQLLLGPPGTGKTKTTAVSVMLRLYSSGEARSLFILSTNTHTAADELMQDLQTALPSFSASVKAVLGATMRPPTLIRILRDERDSGLTKMVQGLTSGPVMMIGTINQVLKLGREYERTYRRAFDAQALIVDEASMMVFPHFLALATLLGPKGDVMLAGDHKQLAPITAHDWESETRPQVLRYAPFQSSYLAIKSLVERPEIVPGQMRQSRLERSYRLTHETRELIGPIYSPEGVVLKGSPAVVRNLSGSGPPGLEWLWEGPGLFLLLHDESFSKKNNMFEADLIEKIISCAGERPEKSIAVITPHRSQRALLKDRLEPHMCSIKMIDTVERLQGGECETVIVSGTQSDPMAIGESAEFILDLNRSNVIFSRARERLIVVCSHNLLDTIPADLETYRSAYLWKRVRSMCRKQLFRLRIDGQCVDVLVPCDYVVSGERVVR